MNIIKDIIGNISILACWIIGILLLLCLLLSPLIGLGIVCSIQQAKTYNKITGKTITWQDVFWSNGVTLVPIKEEK